MAISNSLLLKELSGQIGKQLVFRQYGEVSGHEPARAESRPAAGE